MFLFVPSATLLIVMMAVVLLIPFYYDIQLLIMAIKDADVLPFFGAMFEFAIVAFGIYMLIHVLSCTT